MNKSIGRLKFRKRNQRILVIGIGSIGQRHMRNLLRLGDKKIAAYDVSDDARRSVEDSLSIEVFDSLEAAWDWNPGIVLVATSTQSHTWLVTEAAYHGCHIFVEKPLSHEMSGIDSLRNDIHKRNLVSMVACNMRFHPGPRQVKRLVDEGWIGQVIAARIHTGSYLPSWRPGQDFRQSYSASPESGGAILDCIHEIDLALWYFGPATLHSAVNIPATSISLETDGLTEILLCHNSGVLSSIHLNYVQRDYRRTNQIIGTEGTIYWDFSEHEVKIYGLNGELCEVFTEPDGWEINQMYADELDYFLSCVEKGLPTFNTVAEAAETLRLALAARQLNPATGCDS